MSLRVILSVSAYSCDFDETTESEREEKEWMEKTARVNRNSTLKITFHQRANEKKNPIRLMRLKFRRI